MKLKKKEKIYALFYFAPQQYTKEYHGVRAHTHTHTHTHTYTTNIQFALTCAIARSKGAAATCAPRHGKEAVIVHLECVLFIGTQVTNLYTAGHTPAIAA